MLQNIKLEVVNTVNPEMNNGVLREDFVIMYLGKGFEGSFNKLGDNSSVEFRIGNQTFSNSFDSNDRHIESEVISSFLQYSDFINIEVNRE